MSEKSLWESFAQILLITAVILAIIVVTRYFFKIWLLVRIPEEDVTRTVVVEKVESSENGLTVYAGEVKLNFLKSSSNISQIIVLGLSDDEVLVRLPHKKNPHTKLIFNRNSSAWKDFVSNVEKNGDLIGFYPSVPEKRVYLY